MILGTEKINSLNGRSTQLAQVNSSRSQERGRNVLEATLLDAFATQLALDLQVGNLGDRISVQDCRTDRARCIKRL